MLVKEAPGSMYFEFDIASAVSWWLHEYDEMTAHSNKFLNLE